MSGSSEISVTGENPFRITPDARFFYRGRSADACFESLLLGVQERQGTMLLVGEPGGGKTTLLLNLQNELERAGYLVVYPRRPMLSFDELTLACCEAAGIDKQEIDRIDRVRAFTDLLVGQAEDGKSTAIFIDDAHTVSDDFLIDLSRLTKVEKGGKALLQVVLAGQPELVGRLTASKLTFVQECAIAYRSLEPLGTREVEEYITYRLTRAGYKGPKISSMAMGYVARISRGTPQVVNQICGMSLQMAEMEEANLVGLDLVESVALDLMSDRDDQPSIASARAEDAADDETSIENEGTPAQPDPFQGEPDSATASPLSEETEISSDRAEPDDRALQEAWLEKAFAKEVLGDEGLDLLDRARQRASEGGVEPRPGEAEGFRGRSESEATEISIDWESLEAGLADRRTAATGVSPRESQPEPVIPIDRDRPRVLTPVPKQSDRMVKSAPQRRISIAAMFLVGLLFGGLGVGALWTLGKQQVGPVASTDSGPASSVPEGSDPAEASPVEVADSDRSGTEILVEDVGEAEERILAQAIAPATVDVSPVQVSNGTEPEANDTASNGAATEEIPVLENSADDTALSDQTSDAAEVETASERTVPQSSTAATAQSNDPAEPREDGESLKIPLPPIPKPAIIASAKPEAAESATWQDETEATVVEPEPGETLASDPPVPAVTQTTETAALPARSNPARSDEATTAGRSAGGGSVGAPTSLLPSLAVINRLETALPDLGSRQEQADTPQAASPLPEADNGTDSGPGPAVSLVQTAEATSDESDAPGAAELSRPTSLQPERSQSSGQVAALSNRSEPQEPAVGAQAEQGITPRSDALPTAEPGRLPLPAAESSATELTAVEARAADSSQAGSAPVRPAASSADGQVYMLQLASLASRPDAERELGRLIEKHKDLLGDYDLTIAQGDVQGRSFYRVRSAAVGDSNLAYETCAQLVVRGQGCMVMRGDYLTQDTETTAVLEPAQDLQPPAQDLQTNVKVAGALGATAAAEGVAASSSATFAPQGDMAVLDFLLTHNVEDREPVDQIDGFTASDRQGFAYARIKNLGSPTKIEFLWRRDDALVSRYRTKVGTSGRWRTWSSTDLWPGEWSVALVKEGGEVLAETRFVVE